MKKILLSLLISFVSIPLTQKTAAQSVSVPKFFIEFTLGPGTTYIDKVIGTGPGPENVINYKTDKTYWFAQFSPSIGLEITDRWTVGLRATFQTNNSYTHTHYNIVTLYGQYSFINKGRWKVFVEGKGSYYQFVRTDGGSDDLGEIGFSLGARFAINHHFSLIAHYVYTGVEVGNGRLSRPFGCIGDGRVKLDFSPRRLQLGARYSF